MELRFNGESLSSECIIAARRYFADIKYSCMNDVQSGVWSPASHVNIPEYLVSLANDADDYLSGKRDHTFAFMQRAYYIQTGRCVALLPK